MELFVRSVYFSSAVALGYLFLLYRSNPLRRLPATTVTVCFVVGMVGVIPVEFIHLVVPLPTSGGVTTAFITAGVVEEGVKFVLMWFTIRRLSFPDLAEPIDVAIYFGALGLGFGVYEDFWYVFSSAYPAWSAGNIAEFHTVFTGMILTRALPGHILFDALAGFFIGYAWFSHKRRRTWWMLAAVVIAVGTHGVYDLVARYGGMIPLITYILFLIGVFIYLRTWALAQSPFRAVIELIAGDRMTWPYPRSPVDYLFADGFAWPGKPHGGMFQLFPVVFSLLVLYPLLFGAVYVINSGLALVLR